MYTTTTDRFSGCALAEPASPPPPTQTLPPRAGSGETALAWPSCNRAGGAAAVLLACAVAIGCTAAADPSTDRWAAIRRADIALVAVGWDAPVRLETSDGNWEDSPFVTADGATLLFAYYPAEDLLADVQSGGPFADDIDIYQSAGPFTRKSLDTRFYFSVDLYSAAGPMIAENGEVFYHSNRSGNTDDVDLYRGRELLPFNVADRNWGNPHYCAARDELWFDESDRDIFVLENAAAGGWAGVPRRAPAPINAAGMDVSDFQPWLNRTCDELYFTSGRLNQGPAIFHSLRTEDGGWSDPELVISSRTGVGEASLTGDGRQLFFVQLFEDAHGNHASDLFVTNRQ
ncbi:MAG: hypothetical protein HYV63_15360 [Candidatus Schekmanbacteria bacterium]|nr:hypothetical protein [Candidatus Schekmanbacteria bacterium]